MKKSKESKIHIFIKKNIDFFPELVPFPVYDIFIFYKLLNVFFLFHDRFLAMGNLRDAKGVFGLCFQTTIFSF